MRKESPLLCPNKEYNLALRSCSELVKEGICYITILQVYQDYVGDLLRSKTKEGKMLPTNEPQT